MPVLESTFDAKLMSQPAFRTLLATTLAATFISMEFQDRKDEWKVIVNKVCCNNLLGNHHTRHFDSSRKSVPVKTKMK